MRVLSLLTLAGVCAFGADSGTLSATASKASPEMARIYNGPRMKASMYIWTERYVYRPGEALTVRWTVSTNDDLYPYTTFVYLQNNQTGVKTYLPAGNSTVTDINGNNASQGFAPAALGSASKAVLIGSGGRFPAVNVPAEFGMHTVVVELRDYTGTAVLKSAYAKISVVDGAAETLTGEIGESRTLTNNKEWRISGTVFVNNGAVLTIEPGTVIIGNPGSQPPSILVITQNGRIQAKGTRARPIIMTSSQAFGSRQRGDWGGLIMMGKAPINVQGGTATIEGLPAGPNSSYGGTDPAHNCGTLEYVRVEYAGSTFAPNNEANSFTWGGCGSQTVANHLQAIYGLDDSFEWFGGNMNAKYLVGGLGADDYMDYQLGYTGKIQYAIMYQSPDVPGNRGIEGDNSEFNQGAEPFSNPTFFNVTLVGSGVTGFDEGGSGATGIYARRGSRGSFNNFVVTRFLTQAALLADANTIAQATQGNLKINGLLAFGNGGGNTLTGQLPNADTRNWAGNTTNVANPLMTRISTLSDPDFAGQFSSPIFTAGAVQPPDDGFFDQSAKFLGAIGDVDWTEEWTSFLVETDIRP